VRAYLTGATGFVGSNLARVFGERNGAELFARHTIAACPPERRTSGGPWI
jgi:nucleoside-diphosphate-sugar epimerase